MQVSIIIVSYNVRHYLRQCLQSVWQSAQSAGLEVEVFVVDNHSTDDSIAHLRQHFGAYEQGRMPKARLHLIANKVNVGFGRANNQALKRCTGKYVLFLNPDTIVTERTLADCWAEAERHEHLGAIGVAMLHTNGRFAHESRRGLPTPWTAFCKMSGLARLFPRSKTFGHYYMRYLDENEAHSIEIVSGAFMWCSHQALKECGGFDEQFFMYGEDIDLSYRFLLAGYDNRYLPTP
ncbi:MAG: glycosyltransferase family 2 protein, partial [Bacteroidaceae bacterium]|nr:glycosyltransferase family 2 protein [Bacteroidaceae bacterium]